MKQVQVDVWSDVACPWCWVGKRHLERATEIFDGEVRLVWHAFQLDPGAPKRLDGPIDYVGRLAAKYDVSRPRAQSMIDTMTAAGRESGLDFHFRDIKPVNSFDAHRLIALGKDMGLQNPMKERLLRAYFSEGADIGDSEQLAALAEEAGIPSHRAAEVLASNQYASEVRADLANANELGIRGVPYFLLNRALVVSGAQPPELLAEALEEAALSTVALSRGDQLQGEVCTPHGCG